MDLRLKVKLALGRVARTVVARACYRFGTLEIGALSAEAVRGLGYHSQSGQDVLLDRHFFSGREVGVFVDVGAHDGVTLSNSLFFEEKRSWSGLCVEPNPNVFQKLEQSRSAVCTNVAVASTEGQEASESSRAIRRC